MATSEIAAAEIPPSPQPTGLIAPAWHTAVVICFLLGIAALESWKSTTLPEGELSSRARLANYAIVFVWEWLIVAFIVWGVRRRGNRMSDLIGGNWPTLQSFLRDLGTSVLFLIAGGIVLAGLRLALRDTPNQAVRNLLPDGLAESVVWIALSATAGFCEETIFRGYLQKQFARMTRNVWPGIVFQALIFGACHGYQGGKSMTVIAVYGLLFGLLANYVQSLRPGMMAHFLQDSVAGLLGRAILKRLPAS